VTLSASQAVTNNPVLSITIEFSQAVSGFDFNDIVVDNGAVDSQSFSDQGGGTYTIDIIPQNTTSGQLYDMTVSIPEGVAEDSAGNASEASDEDLVITFDSTAPEVEITAPGANDFDGVGYTNQNPIPVTITFTEPVFGFEGTDIEVDNATFSNFSGSDGDSVYTLNIDPPPGDGPSAITMDIAAGAAEDEAGNSSEAAETLSLVFDQMPPAPVVSTTASSNTNVSPIPIEIDFGETVLGFNESIAAGTISAAEGAGFSIEDFQADSADEVFTFNLVPNADDTFTVELAADVVTDLAGNDNEASNTVEVVFETSNPEITFHAVQEGGTINDDELEDPTNADFFTLFIDFGGQLASFNISSISADNALLDDLDTVNLAEGLYSVRVEPLDDGEVTITIPEEEVQDLAGNGNEEGQFQINSDQTAPTVLSIERSSGVNDPTNQSPFDIVITFSEEIVDFDKGLLAVTNSEAADFSTLDDVVFTVSILPDEVTTTSIILDIGVPAGVFTDLAGNENEADTEDYTIEFGDVRPTVEFTTTATDPNDLEPFAVTLTITEIFGQEVSGFDVADIISVNVAQIELVDDNNPVFELMITPDGIGPFEITLSLPEGAVSDIAGNENEASDLFTLGVERGVDPLPVPISSPLGLLILPLLMLAIGLSRRKVMLH